MAKVYSLPVKPTKLGFKRARKGSNKDLEEKGQLNLFINSKPRIISLPSRFTPFEEALWLDENNKPNAQEAYLKAILENDCTTDAYCNLGILESNTGNTVKAFDCFTTCLKLDERHLEAHYNLANLYFDEGDFRLAKIHYEIAAEIDPEFPNIYFNLGLVYAFKDEYEDAISAFYRYKDLVPKEEGKKVDDLLSSLTKSISKKL